MKDSQCFACVITDYSKTNFGDLIINSSFFNKKILKICIDNYLYNGRREILLYGKDYDISCNYQGIKLPQEARYLIEKYYKNCNSLSIRELQTIFYTLQKLNIANKVNYAPISMLKDIENDMGNILKNNHITFDYEKIKKLSKENQTAFVYTILAKLANLNTPYIHKVELQLPEYIIYHEGGHL